MPAYHITGPSGTGKSTVGRTLQGRGYRVIETDFEPGLSAFHDKETKELTVDLPEQPYTKEWVNSHSWLWNKDKMNELFANIDSEPVFFCGGAHNESDFADSFVARFALHTTRQTLKARLQKREPSRWTDSSAELEHTLNWNDRFEEVSRASGAIVIESSVSPGVIADTILGSIEETESLLV